MENIRKIKREIEAVGLRVEIYSGGLNVFPNDNDAPVIYSTTLKELIAIAQKNNLLYRIDFDTGLVRLH